MSEREERFEHLVKMAMEAWDEATLPALTRYGFTESQERKARSDFEVRVRERLAQSAHVYELLEIAESYERGVYESNRG